MTPRFEGVLAFLAIVALAAGVLIGANVPLESGSPSRPVSMEYEAN